MGIAETMAPKLCWVPPHRFKLRDEVMQSAAERMHHVARKKYASCDCWTCTSTGFTRLRYMFSGRDFLLEDKKRLAKSSRVCEQSYYNRNKHAASTSVRRTMFCLSQTPHHTNGHTHKLAYVDGIPHMRILFLSWGHLRRQSYGVAPKQPHTIAGIDLEVERHSAYSHFLE